MRVALFTLFYHPEKLGSLLCRCTADAVIRKHPSELPRTLFPYIVKGK